MGMVGQPVLAIEDPAVLEVSASVPEEFYDAIRPGETPVRIRVGAAELPAQAIAYRSPTVTRDLRTFEIKTVLARPPAGIAPGRIAHLEVILEARDGVGVPRSAVETRGGTSVVFLCQDNAARLQRVTPGLETAGWMQILPAPAEETAAAPLGAGAPVISQGQRMVDAGTPVRVVSEATP